MRIFEPLPLTVIVTEVSYLGSMSICYWVSSRFTLNYWSGATKQIHYSIECSNPRCAANSVVEPLVTAELGMCSAAKPSILSKLPAEENQTARKTPRSSVHPKRRNDFLSRVISTNFLHFHSLSLSPQRRTVVCLDVTSTQFLPLTNAGELDLAGFITNASPRQSDESSFRGCCEGMLYSLSLFAVYSSKLGV